MPSKLDKKSVIKKALITALISILVIASVLFGRIGTITDTEDSGHKTVLPGDDGEIYASLHSGEQNSVTVYPDISKDSVIALLNESLNQQSDYTWYYKSTLISRDNAVSENGIFKCTDGTYRVDIFDGYNSLLKSVQDDGDIISVQLFNNISGQGERDYSSDSISIFEEIGVPAVEDFINSDDSQFDYSFVDSDYGKLLYAAFTTTSGSYSQLQEYYISLDFGLVVRADCYENEIPVYMLETVSLYRQNGNN